MSTVALPSISSMRASRLILEGGWVGETFMDMIVKALHPKGYGKQGSTGRDQLLFAN